MDHPQPDALASVHAALYPPTTMTAIPFPDLFIALECLDGQCYLSSAPFASTFTATLPSSADIVRHIRACYRRMTVDDNHETWLSRWFTKTIVGTAKVQQILPPSPTAQCSCYRVHLSDFEYDWLLTEAFLDPKSLQGGHIRYAAVASTSSTNGPDNNNLDIDRVITFRKVLDKKSVAAVLIVLLTTSPGLGVLVGYLADSAEAGIAAGAAVFALATFTQLLTAWILG